MIEVVGDLWTYPADLRVITTNGFIKKNGEAVMGRGCAKQARDMFPRLAKFLGMHIQDNGNVACIISFQGTELGIFPVKHAWWEKADLELIRESAETLVEILKHPAYLNYQTIVVPRPGCGNGQLDWEDVRPVLEPIFDERFHVISYE